MLTIINNNTDPRFNLALEEYVLKYLNIDEDFLLVWQNSQSVIIGRNQNPFVVLNGSFIKDNNIPVIRKSTDGTAVFHDLGCINFAFVTKTDPDNTRKFKEFLEPVLKMLQKMGLNASVKKRNNIYIGKSKISLNYQNKYKNKIFHHGILFIDTDFEMMNNVHSNLKTELVNMKKLFRELTTVSVFRLMLLNELLGNEVSSKVYTLDEYDLDKINLLIKKKYGNWDWNYGQSPEFLVKKEYENRMLITLIISYGVIKDITIDSFENTMKLEKALLNTKFNEKELKKVLLNFKEVNSDKMIELLMY